MHIALLIDCENAKPDSIDGILGELESRPSDSVSNIGEAAGRMTTSLRVATAVNSFKTGRIDSMRGFGLFLQSRFEFA
jgi:hypothetical protein